MSTVVELSSGPKSDFPDEWYEVTGDDLFWFEWRFRAFRAQLESLGLPLDAPWHGLDIGCGHGVVRGQIEHASRWTTDGADLNRDALAQNRTEAGDAYYYDIHDRRPALADRYDFVLLFDVLEHLAEPRAFVESALHHLKPGGFVFVNVPALNSMLSAYDEAVGHLRRYGRETLRRELDTTDLEIVDLRYWGFSMLPYLLLRKAMPRQRATRETIVRGVVPPARFTLWPILQIMKLETRFLRRPWLGTSLLLAARKRSGGR